MTVLVALMLSVLSATSSPAPAKNVVLIAIDGLRAQDVFRGPARALMSPAGGVTEEEAALVAKYWRASPVASRAALMPFLWQTVAKEGRVVPSTVTNSRRVSYPGYNEMLAGFADDERVTSNSAPANPNITVFEWLSQQPALAGRVQAFATWETFNRIFNVERSKLDVRAGLAPPFENDRRRNSARTAIDELYRTTTPLFGGNALDAMTFATVKESLRFNKPRVLFIGFGEVDEWMHAGRYDLALESAHRADRFIASLWALMQAMPEYSGSTTFIITTDHGRGGDEGTGWRDHGAEVEGSENAWVAMLGPGAQQTVGPKATQAQLASTVAQLLGYDWPAAEHRAAHALTLSSSSRNEASRTQGAHGCRTRVVRAARRR